MRLAEKFNFATKRFYKMYYYRIMKIEDFEKFIYPQNDLRCFVCKRESANLELFAETEKEVVLICTSCCTRNLVLVREGLADF